VIESVSPHHFEPGSDAEKRVFILLKLFSTHPPSPSVSGTASWFRHLFATVELTRRSGLARTPCQIISEILDRPFAFQDPNLRSPGKPYAQTRNSCPRISCLIIISVSKMRQLSYLYGETTYACPLYSGITILRGKPFSLSAMHEILTVSYFFSAPDTYGGYSARRILDLKLRLLNSIVYSCSLGSGSNTDLQV